MFSILINATQSYFCHNMHNYLEYADKHIFWHTFSETVILHVHMLPRKSS